MIVAAATTAATVFGTTSAAFEWVTPYETQSRKPGSSTAR